MYQQCHVCISMLGHVCMYPSYVCMYVNMTPMAVCNNAKIHVSSLYICHVLLCKYVSTYVMYVCMYVMYICLYECIYVCMYECMYPTYVCMYQTMNCMHVSYVCHLPACMYVSRYV